LCSYTERRVQYDQNNKQELSFLLKTLCIIRLSSAQNVGLKMRFFPNFTVNNETSRRTFVKEFKYLGPIVNNSQLDDADICRERRNVFYRCNMLARRFYSCSMAVKLRLFKSFCLCFYDVALWNNFTAGAFDKFRSAYVKCIKVFFR